jgi:hypothetical protein
MAGVCMSGRAFVSAVVLMLFWLSSFAANAETFTLSCEVTKSGLNDNGINSTLGVGFTFSVDVDTDKVPPNVQINGAIIVIRNMDMTLTIDRTSGHFLQSGTYIQQGHNFETRDEGLCRKADKKTNAF